MSAPPKKSGFPKSLVLTILVTVVGGIVISRGCGSADPNEIPEIPAIRTNAEYNNYLSEVEKLTTAALERSAQDLELTPQDRRNMLRAEPLVLGLIAYDHQRFTHYLLLAKLYFANEKYREALGACNLLFERAPPQGTEDVIAAVAETRYVASRNYYLEKQYLESAAEAKEAVRRMPRSAEYMWAEASARVQLKEIEEAKMLLGTALFFDPAHKKAQQLLRFLESEAKSKK